MSQWYKSAVNEDENKNESPTSSLAASNIRKQVSSNSTVLQQPGYSTMQHTSSTSETPGALSVPSNLIQGQLFYSQAFPSYSNTYGVPYPPHQFVNYQASEQQINLFQPPQQQHLTANHSIIQQYGSYENYVVYMNAYKQYYEQQQQQLQQQYYAYHNQQQQAVPQSQAIIAPPLPPPPVPPPPLPPSPPTTLLHAENQISSHSSIYGSLDAALNKHHTNQYLSQPSNNFYMEGSSMDVDMLFDSGRLCV